VGLAASMGQFLLCAGAPGKRYALPHSRILMHQPSGAMQGQAADIAIQAEQIIYLKRMMAERIAFHTGQPVERIETDSDRDRWFTAEEACEYGFIDKVIDRSAATATAASWPLLAAESYSWSSIALSRAAAAGISGTGTVAPVSSTAAPAPDGRPG